MAKNNKVSVCIIGSGAGGGVVAKELGEKGLSVVVLEAGRRFNPLKDYTAASEDWERLGDQNKWHDKFRVPAMDKITFGSPNLVTRPDMAFGVGGTTLVYLAYVPRFHPDDFRMHTLDGVGADWPIRYEDVAPYYRKVELELGVSGQTGDPWHPPIEPYPNPPFEISYANKILKRGCDKLGIKVWPVPVARLPRPFHGRPACNQCGECESGCMTKAKSSIDVTYIARAEATGKVEIRPECVATQITVDKSGRAKSVVYFDKNKVEHEQEADVIIVSAGTFFTPKLLLNSKSSLSPNGLANSSGLVGKYFIQHLALSSRAVFPDRIDSFRGFFGGAISKDFAKTSRKNSFARGWTLEFHSGLRGPAQTALSLPGWGARHKQKMRQYFGHFAGMVAFGEQLPDERNRIELDPNVVDDYGMPVVKMFMEPHENDRQMLPAIERNIREIYEAAGAEEILHLDYVPGRDAHNMGTCRMGNDPKSSVLNSFCQTHDVPNLFVVDASCFVTGGTSNPGLTIMAIATRTSEYIAEQAKKGNLRYKVKN